MPMITNDENNLVRTFILVYMAFEIRHYILTFLFSFLTYNYYYINQKVPISLLNALISFIFCLFFLLYGQTDIQFSSQTNFFNFTFSIFELAIAKNNLLPFGLSQPG